MAKLPDVYSWLDDARCTATWIDAVHIIDCRETRGVIAGAKCVNTGEDSSRQMPPLLHSH